MDGGFFELEELKMEADAAAVGGKIAIAVLVIVDLILLLVPILMKTSRNRKLARYTIVTEAVVTAMDNGVYHAHHTGSSTPMWYPTFSYTVDGVTYEKRSNVGTTAKPFEVGDRLKIRVDPQDHNKYIMIKSKGFDIAFGVLMALAAFFIIATVITAIAVK